MFKVEEHQVFPSAHGNSWKSHPCVYVRTKESTMKDLKRKAKTQTPKEAYHAVHKEHGGVLSAYSLSDLPRSINGPLLLRHNGPLLLSQKKTFDSYNHFFTKIVSLNNETREILAFGTDGEEELFRAMRYTFPQAIHLRCFSHFMDNCKRQLRLSNVPEKEQKEILFDIFGRQIGETWEQGIITHIIKIVSKFSFYVHFF